MRSMWVALAVSLAWSLYAATGAMPLLTVAVVSSMLVAWPYLTTDAAR